MLSWLSLIPEVISLVRELFSLARELQQNAEKRKVIDFVKDTNTLVRDLKDAKSAEEKQEIAKRMERLIKGL